MNREVKARGLCPSCYDRFQRNDWLDRLPDLPPPISARIVDVLETDGGWLATSTVHELVGNDIQSVRKSLHRLRLDGRVMSRLTRWGSRSENEWRIL